MPLKSKCLCCGCESHVTISTGKRWEQCTDQKCAAAFEDGINVQAPKNADVDTLKALGCCSEKDAKPQA